MWVALGFRPEAPVTAYPSPCISRRRKWLGTLFRWNRDIWWMFVPVQTKRNVNLRVGAEIA